MSKSAGRFCSVDSSHGSAYARGWYVNCYNRWRKRGGDPAVPSPRIGRPIPIEQRIQYRVDRKTGCWVWRRAGNGDGAGRVWFDGKLRLAHRVVYEMVKGPIPDGLQLDHLCANRLCVNPDHLEPVTNRENKLRGGEPHFELRGTVAA